MTPWQRFRGSLIACVLVLAIAGVWLATRQGLEPAEEAAPRLFEFEKDDLVGIKVERPENTVELVKDPASDAWTVVGDDWRPSRSMVRRVAHQIHDLTARATVVSNPADPDAYGLGKGAIHVTLTLEDARTIEFLAGSPNPTDVSYYLQPLPGDTVYVVKKSAVDYWGLDMSEFRERKFAWLDADDAVAIDATVDGRHLAFTRVDDTHWTMTDPVAQKAGRDPVRTMLGRTSALKASAFVLDHPSLADLETYGLSPGFANVSIRTDDETITLRVGFPIADSDPPERYVLRAEDDAIYTAREGFLDAYRLPIEGFRDPEILPDRHAWDLRAMTVRGDGQEIRITHGADDKWSWADGAPIPGSTPSRAASALTELDALAFHADPPPEAALDAPFAIVDLQFDDAVRTVTIGGVHHVERPPMPMDKLTDARPAPDRRYLQVDGDPIVYEVDGSIGDAVDSLRRESAKH